MKRLIIIVLFTLFSIAVFEGIARYTTRSKNEKTLNLEKIFSSDLDKKEQENRFSLYNYFLAKEYSKKDEIKNLFLGTSRTKILKPSLLNVKDTFNAGGNSYGEMSNSLLLDIIILKGIFPNLKTVYVETSLLMRRNREHFFVEDNHKKYLGYFQENLDFFEKYSFYKKWESFLNKSLKNTQEKKLLLHEERDKFKLSSLLLPQKKKLSDSKILKSLNSAGEQKSSFPLEMSKDKVPEEIDNKHIKVRRLTRYDGLKSWDRQFELIVDYCQRHQLDVILFQPPVRSDLYQYQEYYNLAQHTRDIELLAASKNTIFLNFNTKQSGFTTDWHLFGDHDHLTTKRGNVLFLTGLFNSTKDSKLINKESILQFLSKEKPALHRKYFLKDQ